MNTTTGRRPRMADTSNMVVVHSAIRRDLVRIRLLLDGPEATRPATRRLLARHLRWFLDFLDHHHTAEDAWLWPVLRARGQAQVADAMEGGHARLAPAVAALRTALDPYETGRAAPATLASAVDELATLLAVHLAQEEERAMPLANRLVTRREWMSFEKEGALKGRSMRELGWDANWIMDGTTPPAAPAVPAGGSPAGPPAGVRALRRRLSPRPRSPVGQQPCGRRALSHRHRLRHPSRVRDAD